MSRQRTSSASSLADGVNKHGSGDRAECEGLGYVGQMSRRDVVVACVGDVDDWSGRGVDCHGMKISLSGLRICHAHNLLSSETSSFRYSVT